MIRAALKSMATNGQPADKLVSLGKGLKTGMFEFVLCSTLLFSSHISLPKRRKERSTSGRRVRETNLMREEERKKERERKRKKKRENERDCA